MPFTASKTQTVAEVAEWSLFWLSAEPIPALWLPILAPREALLKVPQRTLCQTHLPTEKKPRRSCAHSCHKSTPILEMSAQFKPWLAQVWGYPNPYFVAQDTWLHIVIYQHIPQLFDTSFYPSSTSTGKAWATTYSKYTELKLKALSQFPYLTRRLWGIPDATMSKVVLERKKKRVTDLRSYTHHSKVNCAFQHSYTKATAL